MIIIVIIIIVRFLAQNVIYMTILHSANLQCHEHGTCQHLIIMTPASTGISTPTRFDRACCAVDPLSFTDRLSSKLARSAGDEKGFAIVLVSLFVQWGL